MPGALLLPFLCLLTKSPSSFMFSTFLLLVPSFSTFVFLLQDTASIVMLQLCTVCGLVFRQRIHGECAGLKGNRTFLNC